MTNTHRLAIITLCSLLAAGCGSDTSTPIDETPDVDNGGDSSTPAPLPEPTTLIADTGQSECFNAKSVIDCPVLGYEFFGQDAQHQGHGPNFTDNGDGTITDNVTGLMWQQSPDQNGDGVIDASDKLGYEQAAAAASEVITGGYNDWRLPTIKELYSLIDFSGVDPSGYEGSDTSDLVPFIDTNYFGFGYGDQNAGERIIDAQYATTSVYNGIGANGIDLLFGVNFADGRIKGYGVELHGQAKTFNLLYVRGEAGYGDNQLVDNGDGTISDASTGLMWSQADSGTGMNWEAALAYAQAMNDDYYLGYNDWRVPNAKELQALVDYSRSPDGTDSAAIDPVFESTQITNEGGQADYPAYWTSTTHKNWSSVNGGNAVYVNFGRALGYMNGEWQDVHGAGAQRSDPKVGDAADYPEGHGPQGDAIRIDNYVRLVRDAD
ncbi:DUF1566 domain-containing protein [Paraferrimonas sedimenticola]|uniref:Lcl C-terminal domain-containing protein n=1 Tax=Paraferrimonas sedimenticola TaxID=375674 RepID=A0AA37RSY5_9GAMM|nr:DUF1566 domain-containing protein [Paraferrimonas sedimenticola]GLP95355.1 hypothetical protein GCM10007895_06610 [Paraferrimonas sedimenticola]